MKIKLKYKNLLKILDLMKQLRSFIYIYGIIFCDWYIEFSKPLLNSKDKNLIFETKNVLNHVQKENLLLLHSFIPFVTEELWHLSGFKKTEKMT